MSTVRVVKDKDYSVINNTVLNDLRLTWKAKGLAAYLLSKPDNWCIVREHLEKQSADGISSVRSALQELEQCGYLVRTRRQNAKGLFEWEQVLYEQPIPVKAKQPSAENPPVDKPPMENPPVENVTLLSIEVVNTDLAITEVVNTEQPNPTSRDARKSSSAKSKNELGQSNSTGQDKPVKVKTSSEWVKSLLTDEEIDLIPLKAFAIAKSVPPATVVAYVATFLADRQKGPLDSAVLAWRIEHPEKSRPKPVTNDFLASEFYRRHYPLTPSQIRARAYSPDPPPVDDWIAQLPYPNI